MRILSGIAWAFTRKSYDSEAAFDQEVTAYQARILKERARWEPGQVVLPVPEMEVCYEACIKGREALMPNETLVNEDEAFEEGKGNNGFCQVALCARLKAANGAHFTALDLMYQLQRQVGGKELGDHIFFEGLTPASGDTAQKEVPLYYLDCGS